MKPVLPKKFILVAMFDSDRFNDSVVEGIVGRRGGSSGTNLLSGERDLSFEFKDEREAKKALQRLKKSKLKGKVFEEALQGKK